MFRPLEVLDGGGYHRDIAICWVAHSKEPFFAISATDQDGFAVELAGVTKTATLLMAEDSNPYYESGEGPVALVSVHTDGWKVEPHCEFFPWATAKNKLRVFVAFFQMARYKKIGACVASSLDDSKPLFDKTSSYGVLHFVGKIPNGDPRGDLYLYSVRGKR
jgi:hypothetical protein